MSKRSRVLPQPFQVLATAATPPHRDCEQGGETPGVLLQRFDAKEFDAGCAIASTDVTRCGLFRIARHTV